MLRGSFSLFARFSGNVVLDEPVFVADILLSTSGFFGATIRDACCFFDQEDRTTVPLSDYFPDRFVSSKQLFPRSGVCLF